GCSAQSDRCSTANSPRPRSVRRGMRWCTGYAMGCNRPATTSWRPRTQTSGASSRIRPRGRLTSVRAGCLPPARNGDWGLVTVLMRPVAIIGVAALTLAAGAASASADAGRGGGPIKHLVVIYQENHSFDNLFGGWEGVDGLAAAGSSGHVLQRAADGSVLPALPQNEVNLASLTLPNQPFHIDNYIA